MLYAEKGNRVYTIQENEIQKYLDKGCNITDVKGNILHRTVSSKIEDLKEIIEDQKKTIEDLQSQIELLKAEKKFNEEKPKRAKAAKTETE